MRACVRACVRAFKQKREGHLDSGGGGGGGVLFLIMHTTTSVNMYHYQL